jgi:uncharacterized protein YjiS (DUF1127 family)
MSATFRLPRISRVVSIALFPPAISLGAVVRRQWRLVVAHLRQRRAMAQLQRLSDRSLKDLGVPRSQIRWMSQHGR